MLPLSLLRTGINHPVLVELKNGETYNGNLVSCDSWMNINLKKVIHTSRDGDRFWLVPEVYIRGNTIKYLCIPDEVIDKVTDEPVPNKDQERFSSRGGRGGRGGATRGRGGGRGSRGGATGPSRGGRGRT